MGSYRRTNEPGGLEVEDSTAGASGGRDHGIVKDPEVGDHVKIQGVIRHIYQGEAVIKIFRPGEGDPGIVWVQCGALEHVEEKGDPGVISAH